MTLSAISGGRFRERLAARPLSTIDHNNKPRLHWIAIASLRVDTRYQRDIKGRASEENVVAIAAEFDWTKFAPVVVAEVEEGLFAIIDGQHRTTAAALRGVRDVPCLIVQADLAGQAKAFAAINGKVTAVSSMQLFHAGVAAGDRDAVELRDACAEAGVVICRYPVPAKLMVAGQTLAAVKLAGQLKRYGRDTFVSALCCITKTGDGHPGFVRAPLVEALCASLSFEPEWRRDRAALVKAMQRFDFTAAWNKAAQTAAAERIGIAAALIESISEFLDANMESAK